MCIVLVVVCLPTTWLCLTRCFDLQFWSSSHNGLLDRVRLVPGDMFEAETIPSPPADSNSTAYALRNILHNWCALTARDGGHACMHATESGAAAASSAAAASPRPRLYLGLCASTINRSDVGVDFDML